MSKLCAIDGCNNQVKAKGYCNKHYTRLTRSGQLIQNKEKPNEYIEHEDCYEMIFYNKGVPYSTYIDKEDYEKVKKIKWYLTGNDKNKFGYLGNTKFGRLHRFILDISDNEVVVDHRDGNTLNNRKSNLRICDQQKNCFNHKVHKRNLLQQKGVSKNKSGKYVARIGVNNKVIHLGTFATIEEAVEARYKAECEIHGEYSGLLSGRYS